jgi:DNA topoisomerase-1
MEIKLGRAGKFLSCSRYPDCDGALTLDGQEVGDNKPFGIHPKTGEEIYLLTGRFGPYVQLGKTPPKQPKVKKSRKKVTTSPGSTSETTLSTIVERVPATPRRASLPPKMKPEDMTLDLAVKLLELPRELGIDSKTSEPVIANIGRFGPYVGVGREFRSIKKSSGLDPYMITFDEAMSLINTPKQLPKGVELLRIVGVHPKTKKEIQILKSKSGNFIRQGLSRIYVPDTVNPMGISLDEVVALIAMASADKKRK